MFYLPTIGGVEQVMYELAKRQVKAGHEVHVYCCDSDKTKRIKNKEEVIEGVHIHRSRYLIRLSVSTFIWPGLILKLPRYKFDIIHSHVSGHLYILIAGIIAKLKGSKHVHTTHCPWTTAFRPLVLRPFVFLTEKFFNKIAYRFCDKIVALSPWEMEILEKYTNKEKIIVIPNGMPEYMFKKVKNNNFKEKLGIKGKIVLFFGRFNITKGPDKLALAAKELVKERKDINFVFVGPDEGIKQKVIEITKNLPRIKILEPIRGIKRTEVYQAADLFVLPSYREGLPLTLFEAMASELPIIASPVNGIPYEMKEPENGFFVNYGDIKGLKARIIQLMDDKALAKKMALNNKRKALDYSWGKIAYRYESLYKELLQN